IVGREPGGDVESASGLVTFGPARDVGDVRLQSGGDAVPLAVGEGDLREGREGVEECNPTGDVVEPLEEGEEGVARGLDPSGGVVYLQGDLQPARDPVGGGEHMEVF